MADNKTMEFKAGEKSSALIQKLVDKYGIPADEVLQKGLTFMLLYSELEDQGKHLLIEEKDGKQYELTL